VHFSNQEHSLILSSEELFFFLAELYREIPYSGKCMCCGVWKEENSFSFLTGVFEKESN